MRYVGYSALIERFGLSTLAPDPVCYLQERGHRQTRTTDGRTEEFYRPRDDPGDHWTDHLGFALKHEPLNLEVLSSLFLAAPEAELVAWISATPTSRYTRQAWFLYEWLTGRKLPLADLGPINSVNALDPEQHYALPRERAELVRRQRVVNNLPGTPAYCPLVRRTARLRQFEEARLDEQAAKRVAQYPSELLMRASQYLYTKETKSSYAIEHLEVDQRRTARFVELLRQAGRLDCYSEEVLTQLQKAIVEERYAAEGFRTSQNYVGESLGPTRELVHYVSPKPQDLPALMSGWMACCRQMEKAKVHPVVNAAVAGFGFVFLHPYEDGNGRLHRFLLHHALTAGDFTPQDLIFPVSATMLKQRRLYDAALEAYSRQIAQHVEYELDDQGVMKVVNETVSFYRYPDLTVQAEALFGFVRDTIETELVAELEYLSAFDAARRRMRNVVDMPDRRMDLFVRLCLQGKGHLSKAKREQFSELTDEECRQLEQIVGEEISRVKPVEEE